MTVVAGGHPGGMRIGTSLLLIAVGAILRFAVEANADGFNIQTAGLILIVIGAVGLVLSLFLYGRTRETVVERPVVRERERY